MKKIVITLLTVFSIFSCLLLSGCSPVSSVQIAYIVHAVESDTEYLSEGWESVERFCADNELEGVWYVSENRTLDSQLAIVDTAIGEGAEVVVFPSCTSGVAAYRSAIKYPDVKFILVDTLPVDESNKTGYIPSNVGVIMFDNFEAGFLAGYSAVKEGLTRLGFIGGVAQTPIEDYGHGFICGADFAAEELELEPGGIELKYLYTGTFLTNPQCQTKASKWYWQGTELIFSCSGDGIVSIIAAAESYPGAWVIASEKDYQDRSEVLLASAFKNAPQGIYNMLESVYNDEFQGGTITYMTLEDNQVGLSIHRARYESFRYEHYLLIRQRLIDGACKCSIEDADSPIKELEPTYVEIILDVMR